MRAHLLIAGLFLMISGSAWAQQGVSIAIDPTQHSDGFFHPGDTLMTEVTAPRGCFVGVSAGLHYRTSPVSSPTSLAPFYRFAVNIPVHSEAGNRELMALVDCPPKGSKRRYATASFDVELGSLPPDATLSTAYIQERLVYAGQMTMVNIYLSSNGSRSWVSHSRELIGSSEDPSIVLVDGSTITAGHHPGTTIVTFSLGGLHVKLPVTNKATGIPGDFNGDGKVDLDDLHILQSVLGYPHAHVVAPDDPRDLDHDGMIDESDAEAFIALCTFRNCARQTGAFFK